jgi:hypothetical protein
LGQPAYRLGATVGCIVVDMVAQAPWRFAACRISATVALETLSISKYSMAEGSIDSLPWLNSISRVEFDAGAVSILNR